MPCLRVPNRAFTMLNPAVCGAKEMQKTSKQVSPTTAVSAFSCRYKNVGDGKGDN